ncbi:MAG: tolA protein [Pseudobdellovibrionaceae bacterium]
MNRIMIVFFIFFMRGGPSSAASSDIKLLYTKQIAWTAVHMDEAKVIKSFQTSFQGLLNNPSHLSQLKDPEGQIILQQGKKLLRVISLKDNLEKCLLDQAASQSTVRAISKAMAFNALSTQSCLELKEEPNKMESNGRDFAPSFKEKAKNKILSLAHSQLEKTRKFWKEAEKENAVKIAIELSDREQDMKEHPPQSGTELLLYTKVIQDRKNKDFVSQADVKNAFLEVQEELNAHRDYLSEVTKQGSDEALQSLIVTNPAAAAEFLMENPESLSLVCKVLQDYDTKIKRRETVANAFFWGGLVVGGTLLATGVGAGLGVAVRTLTAVAAGAVLTETVSAGSETLYNFTQFSELYAQAQSMRSSAFAEGPSADSLARAEKAKTDAYSELASAGFSAVSIIPFAAGFKAIERAAQASQRGSKVETELVKSIALTLKEVSSDGDVLKILEKAQQLVSAEEMATFLGYLSDLPASKRKEILDLVKGHPDKVPQAIHGSAKTGVCK